MSFESYAEAHEKLNLPGSYKQRILGTDRYGISSLKLTDHCESYNRYDYSGRIIYYVGIGLTKSPGHPSGNQIQQRQRPFWQSWVIQNTFPILRKRYDGIVELLGYYRVVNMQKRLGNEGFTYFEIELHQVLEQSQVAAVVSPRAQTASPTLVPSRTPLGSGDPRCYRCDVVQDTSNGSSIKRVSFGHV